MSDQTSPPTPGEQQPPASPPDHTDRPRVAHSLWLFWLPPIVLLTILVLTLIWLLWPGTRIFPQPQTVYHVPDETAQSVNGDIIAALEQRAADLQTALDGAMCSDAGELILDDGRTPEGLLPGTQGDRAQPGTPTDGRTDSVLPPSPDRVQIDRPTPEPGDDPTADPAQERNDTPTLLAALEQQTVLILAASVDGLATGTGFFVGPDLVMTNHHVVTASNDVRVANDALGGALRAQVIASLGPLETSGGDFALLRVDGANQPFFPLRDSASSMRLENVIAAGYPGAILETDNRFDALLAGDMTAVPQLAVTDGIVNVEQDFMTGTRVMIHTARISQGNSGGPLVDYCGRVVGVNTFGRTSDERHLNFSIASSELIRFLDDSGVTSTLEAAECVPQVSRAAPPPRAETDVEDSGEDDGNTEGEAADASTED